MYILLSIETDFPIYNDFSSKDRENFVEIGKIIRDGNPTMSFVRIPSSIIWLVLV